MSKITPILFALTFIIGLSSCSKKLSPFTNNLYQSYSWSDQDLQKIQFYLSSDIVLWRDFGNSKTRLENGSIKMVDGRQVEEIIFREGTPGVFDFRTKSNKLAISFEQGKDKFLIFGPSKKARGRYVLLAKDWDGNRGKVEYAGEMWNTNNQASFAVLMVDLDRTQNTKYKKKTVSGQKVR